MARALTRADALAAADVLVNRGLMPDVVSKKLEVVRSILRHVDAFKQAGKLDADRREQEQPQPPGRPPRVDLIILTSGLAALFYVTTGEAPTTGWEYRRQGQRQMTAFQEFLEAVWQPLGETTPRNRIQSHDRWKEDYEILKGLSETEQGQIQFYMYRGRHLKEAAKLANVKLELLP